MQHDLLLVLDLQHFVLSLSPVVPRQPSFIFSSISLNFLEHALFDPRFKLSIVRRSSFPLSLCSSAARQPLSRFPPRSFPHNSAHFR